MVGFEPKPGRKLGLFKAETAAFPEYYAQYFKDAMLGGTILPFVPLVRTGPVSDRNLEPLKLDIDNLKAALAASGAKSALMPPIAPSGAALNDHYRTQD